MAKKESNFTNMVVTLFLVTLIASTALGFVYNLTKNPIEAAKLAKKTQAIENVIPGFTNNPFESAYNVPTDGGDSLTVYPAKDGEELIGYAVESYSNKGYGGTIRVMVGFLPNGTINDINVIQHKETPGLGDKIQSSKSDWSDQFDGKNPANFSLQVKKDGGDVDAITASTISSRAYCEAVTRAYNAINQGGAQ
jgi:Na+-translocating ferredoxin:NAD+ oxidoreductase subunit G